MIDSSKVGCRKSTRCIRRSGQGRLGNSSFGNSEVIALAAQDPTIVRLSKG